MKPITFPALQVIGAFAVMEAFVRKPAVLFQESVFPAKLNPIPPNVVVCNLPFASAESKVFVATEKIVELLNVAVLLAVRPALNVCAAVQVTLEAAVTKPGFTKLIVTVPVAALALILVPEAIEETPTTVPVAPLKDVTPTFVRTLPARLRPVEIEVVPNTPFELKNASVLVTPLTVILVVVTLPVLFTWKPPFAPTVSSEAGVVVPMPSFPLMI